MSARDDYQDGTYGAQHFTMCDEIDRLRSLVADMTPYVTTAQSRLRFLAECDPDNDQRLAAADHLVARINAVTGKP